MRSLAAVLLFFIFACNPDLSGSNIDMPASLPTNNNSDSTTLRFLALGDSYTIGESVDENERWPVQLVERINEQSSVKMGEPVIIARTGWRTDELIDAISRTNPPENFDLVSLLIGVNNQYQRRPIDIYREEFSELLQTAIKKAGGNKDKVLVVSIPDYGYTPFGEADQERISRELDEYNQINREISATSGVLYINITDISRSTDPGLVADDRLHPSAEQYRRWVDRILADPDFRSRYIKN